MLQETVEAGGAENIPQNIRLPAELRGTVRMSHAHAKTLAILMKRMLKAFEQQSGEIQIPQPVMIRHEIIPEEW